MATEKIQELVNVLKGFHGAMLVTRNNGELHARPMVVAKLEGDGDLWFATASDSGKVEEILAEPNVCVTMAGGGDYASISGAAEIIGDRSRIDDLWNEAWRVWFPDGPEDPRIALIRVHAASAEYWNNSGTNRLKYLFDAAQAYIRGTRPEAVDSTQHAQVDLT